MDLGERIRTLRSSKNLSQNDLADALNVSRQSVSKWETNGAIPDLEKLMGMSELFGVTLDSLVKGTPPPEAPADAAEEPSRSPTPVKRTHTTAGVILLCFGALITILFFVLGAGWTGLLLASPFLFCGAICLCVHKRTGLWCIWAVFFCVDFYLRYATGITWQIIFMTLQFTPEMNYMRLAIGWGQFLWIVLLLGLTLRSFRGEREPWDKRRLATLAAGLALLIGIVLVQRGLLAYWHALPYEQVNEAWYFWLRFLGDSAKMILLTALLVKSAAILRQRKADRQSAAKIS